MHRKIPSSGLIHLQPAAAGFNLNPNARHVACVIMTLIVFGFATSAEASSTTERGAVAATVTGNDQQVGFRAMVMKQAIQYNLAGSARNDTNEIVHFTLHGYKKRIDSALATIRKGTKKSSDIKVTTTPAAIDPNLNTFTIVDWTSSSRQITNQYNLVFELRLNDAAISPAAANATWRRILETTLSPDDRKKLRPDD